MCLLHLHYYNLIHPNIISTSDTIAITSMESRQVVRNPSHAGSWYSSSKAQLSSQLDGWLEAVNVPVTCIGPLSEGETIDVLPAQGARVIIAP